MIASGNPSARASTTSTTATTKVPRITVSARERATVTSTATFIPASSERQQVDGIVERDERKILPSSSHSGASGQEVTNDDENDTPSSSNDKQSDKLLDDQVDHVHAHLSLDLSHSKTINAHRTQPRNRVSASLKNDDFSRKSNTFIATQQQQQQKQQQQQHYNYFGSNNTNGKIKLIDENDILLNESSQLVRNESMKVTRFTRDTTWRQITDYIDPRESGWRGNSSLSSIEQVYTLHQDDRNYRLNSQQMVHTNDENIYQQPVEKVTGNANKRTKKTSRSKSNTSKANLIFILTDDQDVELGKYARTKNIFTHGAIS